MHSHNTAAAPGDAHGSCDHDHAGRTTANDARAESDSARTNVVDPVCGMRVDWEKTGHRQSYQDRIYYFCSAGCREKFAADPVTYLGPKTGTPAPVPEGAVYTCPMHPEIRQNGPGTCPICGMALEPVTVTAETGPNPELLDMTRRFWVALSLSVPVVALDMGGHLFALHMLIGPTLSNWIELVFATPVVLWAGWPFFVRGWQSLVTRNLNMFTLIAMGTGLAYIYSLIGTIAPQSFPETFRGHGGAVPVYFEAASVITVLVLLGQV